LGKHYSGDSRRKWGNSVIMTIRGDTQAFRGWLNIHVHHW
jgi:hypothetical protein